MSYKTSQVTLAAAVAQNATFTASYPDGTSAGSFAAYGHKMFSRGLQAYFSQDAGEMSVSFGASSITVTYKGATSLPADKIIALEFNIAGDADAPADIVAPKRVSYAPVMLLDLGTPDTADSNGILESQDLTAAGVYSVLAFNGVYGDTENNEKAVLDVPRNVVAAWTGAAVLTVTGKDEYGDVIVESSASGTSHTGAKAFKEITDISVSANVTSITVGTGDVLGLPVYIDKASRILGELQDGVLISPKPTKVYLQGSYLEATVDAGTSYELVCPVAGYINKLTTIVGTGNGITTGGAITVEVNTVAVTGLSVVVADAAAEGDVDSDTPTTAHSATTVVAVGDRIEIIAGAAFNASADLNFILEIDVDPVLDGTFVAGDQTAPTATTGDVKGTYDPTTACSGAIAFALMVAVPDPSYRGVDNFDG